MINGVEVFDVLNWDFLTKVEPWVGENQRTRQGESNPHQHKDPEGDIRCRHDHGENGETEANGEVDDIDFPILATCD